MADHQQSIVRTAAHPQPQDRELGLRLVECGGFHVHLGRQSDYLKLVYRCVEENNKTMILNHNLHSLYLYTKDDRLKHIYDRSVVMVDGTGILLLLRLHGYNAHFENRMAWLDFIWPFLCFANRRRLRIYWIGNSPEVNAQGIARIRSVLPGLSIAGHHGYFDQNPGSDASMQVVESINAFQADACIVGMGSPIQEYWMDHHQQWIAAPVMFSAGACLEYIAGVASTPPRFLGPLGLEWAYRLLSHPRRFAFRYLVEPWHVAWEIGKHNWARVTVGKRLRDCSEPIHVGTRPDLAMLRKEKTQLSDPDRRLEWPE